MVAMGYKWDNSVVVGVPLEALVALVTMMYMQAGQSRYRGPRLVFRLP